VRLAVFLACVYSLKGKKDLRADLIKPVFLLRRFWSNVSISIVVLIHVMG
jgi:hypothetical protein